MAKIGRPKGSKNKPKWLKEALEAQKPKRGRGRPKGSKNKPKTIEGTVEEALNTVVEPPVIPPKPKRKGHPAPWLNAGTPEERSERARKAAYARIAKEREHGRHPHVPTGWTLKQVIVAHELTKQETKRILDIMADAGVLPEDENAKEAMSTVVGIMRGSQSNDMKLKAARTVLEYTKAKPTTKAEVTVKSAEDFLDELAEEEAPPAE